jgi:hypothetical protein
MGCSTEVDDVVTTDFSIEGFDSEDLVSGAGDWVDRDGVVEDSAVPVVCSAGTEVGVEEADVTSVAVLEDDCFSAVEIGDGAGVTVALTGAGVATGASAG